MATREQEQELCDRCHERPATCHICHGNSDREGESLCRECFEAANPSITNAMGKAWGAGCRYCGGKPYSGGGYSCDELGISIKMNFMCQPCAGEYFGFLNRKLPGFGNPDITAERAAELRKQDIAGVLAEAESHMKAWVADRGSE